MCVFGGLKWMVEISRSQEIHELMAAEGIPAGQW